MKLIRSILKISFCLIFLAEKEIFAFRSLGEDGLTLNRVRRPEDATDSDFVLDFVGLVEPYGYPAEEHYVTTEDGYILLVHRIPGSQTVPKAEGKPVAFVQHGFLCSSDSWIQMDAENDIVFNLADAGYDVWLGNARGNTYSRNHTKLNPNTDAEFWDFTFQEMGYRDLPAVIDYVLKETKQSSIAVYLAHSMGTTMSYVLLSTKPEYNEKINLVISLAPVAFWTREVHPSFDMLLDNLQMIKKFLKKKNVYELFPQVTGEYRLGPLCSDGGLFQAACERVLEEARGQESEILTAEMIQKTLKYFPAGSSMQTFFHFAQLLINGKFNSFDYGEEKNMQVYKSATAPDFDLTKVKAPIILIYSKADELTDVKDVEKLKDSLPNCVLMERVKYEEFSHINFLVSKRLKELLNSRIMELIEQYKKS